MKLHRAPAAKRPRNRWPLAGDPRCALGIVDAAIGWLLSGTLVHHHASVCRFVVGVLGWLTAFQHLLFSSGSTRPKQPCCAPPGSSPSAARSGGGSRG